MSHVDLSTLRGPELRRLLDSTRRRGEAALSYQILQEMALRREQSGPQPLSRGRRSSEPHVIELNLGDPLDRHDEFEEPAEFEPEPQLEPQTDLEPHDLAPEAEEAWEASPEPELSLSLEPRQAPTPRAPRRWGWTAVAFLLGIGLGAAIGWRMEETLREPVIAPLTVAAAAPPPAAAAPQPIPAPEPTTPIAPPTDPAMQAAPIPGADGQPASSDSSHAAPASDDAAQDGAITPAVPSSRAASLPAVQADRKADAATADAVRIAPANSKGCAAQATPADRTICGSPALQRLQRELREAYAEALKAHADRALLRERQLAWRDARNDMTDPDQLARLYEQRIHKLNAATADAEEQQQR